MKKRKFKLFVKKIVLSGTFLALLLSLVLINTTTDMQVSTKDEEYEYVNNSIFTNNMPVIQEEKHIIKPFNNQNVEISKKFYDKELTDEEKQNALIYYNDTYIQNSGILYKSNEKFDVISILDGTVLEVKKDPILGNVVEIKHDNNVISTYEGLETVNVQQNQIIKQGDVLGTSGKLELGETIENGLLFEIIKDGKYINPNNYFDKKVSEL